MDAASALDEVLARLSDAQVEALAAACRDREKPYRLSDVVVGGSPGAHEAVERLAAAWAEQPGLTGAGIALGLGIGLHARREAAASRSRAVWTGPGAGGEQRLTGAVLHELIAAASKRIVLISYAAHTLGDLAADLEAAVKRGCAVDVVFETEADSAGAYSTLYGRPFEGIAGIRRWRWPAAQREAGAVLHAKLLVVDGRRALVGSANLTHRALSVNLEVGVLIEDRTVAAELEAHVDRLIGDGVLVDAASGIASP
jgi:phosphatidylserine/phosphatidylglycerophosphate/cardiolipin synthase-like enzyme